MSEGKGSSQMARVVIPDIKAQKCIVLSLNDTVWAAKQLILDKIFHDLPKDPLNYSLYLPASGGGKLGKFLDDGYLLSHYAMQGKIPRLEMRYKRRDYSLFSSLSEKAIIKANSKPNQKKLTEYLTSGTVKKVEKLLESGLDPNFVMEDGNTPLGMACGRNGNIQCIMPLLSAGAHIDFRGKDGLTPMHRAAIGGNAPAVNILLSYRASPNYRDAKGLTPVFHTAIMGDDTAACFTLLRHRAELGCTDHGGWTELHHAAKYGHCQHIDLLIRYGADINAQNLVGNTPLHVAASHGQSHCALLLMKRGASRDQANFAGQTPSQVAILCGHHKVSAEIQSFDASQLDTVMLSPEYNPNARIFAPATFAEKKVSELCPVKPPVRELARTLTEDWQDKSLEDVIVPTCADDGSYKSPIPRTDSTSTNGSVSLRGQDNPQADTESIGSTGSTQSGSGGPNTPKVGQSHFQQQRERLYRAGAGKYIVVQDFDPQGPGDIPLRRGMPAEVLFIGKGGYWEGKVGGREGWFPCAAIKEVTNNNIQLPVPNIEPDHPPVMTQQPPVHSAGIHRPVPAPSQPVPQPSKGQATPESEDKLEDLPSPSAADAKKKLNVRDVIVVRGNKGYGFAMRGVRAAKMMQFQPSPQVPALQYIGNVDPGGAAAEAGLCTGDFLLEVNGHNVTHSTHDEVVNIVRKSGGTLCMKVVTPLTKPKSVSQQIKQQLTPVATPERNRKDGQQQEQEIKEDSSKPLMKSSILGEVKPGDRETVIGASTTLPRSKGSPAVPPKVSSRSGWDSSQEDISPPARPGTQTLGRTATYSHHPISSSSSTTNQNDYGPPETYDLGTRSKSITLPPPDYPRAKNNSSFKSPSQSEGVEMEVGEGEVEEEEESSFAKALRERKNELAKRSAEKLRLRANTMPERNSPLLIKKSVGGLSQQSYQEEVDEQTQDDLTEMNSAENQEMEKEAVLSPLQMELLKANKKRSERLEMNQPRITKSKTGADEKKEKPSVSNNPLAKALSQRIESFTLAKDDDWNGDDFESSPGPSPVQSPKRIKNEVNVSKVAPKTKLPPPTVKPKPSKKATPGDVRKGSESPINVPSDSEQNGVGSLPFKVNLKSRSDRNRFVADTDTRRSESPVNVSTNDIEDGRASPLPFKVNLRRGSGSRTKDEKKKKEDGVDGDSFAVNWKSVLKPSGGSGRASPVTHVTDSKPSPKPVLESLPTPDSGQAGSEIQFSFEAIPPDQDFILPPPLQMDEDNRISFIDLEPPEGFYVEGVESTADSGVAGDLPAFLSPTTSEGSSIPPPIPNSSPPEVIPDQESLPNAFVFPDFGGDVSFPDVHIPEPKPISPMNSVDLPSPLPSPTSRGSSRMEDILSPIPPPMFGGAEEVPDVPSSTFKKAGETGDVVLKDATLSTDLLADIATSTSKTSLDSDNSDSSSPPPPPSEPPPFLDINESVDIIDASIKSLEELDGLFLQEPSKPTLSVIEEKPKEEVPHIDAELVKLHPPSLLKSKPSDAKPVLEQNFELEPKSEQEPAEREPTIGFMEVSPIAESAILSAIPAKEAPSVAKKPPQVQDKPPKSSPPEGIGSRVAPEGTAKPKEEFPAEESVQPSYKGKSISDWVVEDVCHWLKDIGLGEHASMFEENEIIGEHLLDFGKDDLKELGVKKLGHQKTFLSKLNLLL